MSGFTPEEKAALIRVLIAAKAFFRETDPTKSGPYALELVNAISELKDKTE